jgi:RNA polymerase sigma-70 factor, ECF subfamily
MFRNAFYLITLAGHPFSAAFLAGMTREMDPTGPKSQQRELTALLRALANGEQSALQPLYVRTSAKLYGICLRLLKNPDDAQDVLQSVFVTAWQKAHAFDPAKASPITWLAAMTRNRAIDRLRQRSGNLEDLEAAADVADDQPSAIEVIEEAQDRTRLSHCLEELEERPRTMIRAAFLDGATYPELARREGVPLSTMKSWIRRGLMKLRGCMER